MPETGALIGTPASIRASVEPQTEPIDDEPFDSSVSETSRIVYGTSSRGGVIGRGAHGVGLEVGVVHVAAFGFQREVVDPLALLRRAEREQRHDLGLPPREQRRA